MPSGRLEKETKKFEKIEAQLKELPEIFTEYYYEMRSEKKSYRTIEEYLKSLKSFMLYVTNGENDKKFYKKVDQTTINKYMITLETKVVKGKVLPTSSGNRANHWYAINSFFEFLIDNGYISKNPVSHKSRPKITDSPSVTYLTEEEIKNIMKNIKRNAKPEFVNRDLCIFILGVTTGLRVAAITQINIEDVDLNNNLIHVIEKRNKSFDVMIGDAAKKSIIRWMADRRGYYSNANTNALFVSQFKERISYDTIRRIMIKYSNGITDKNVTPHVMRHSCATNLYEKTGDIYLCSAQLHHSNVTTTQRYADISDNSRKKAVDILNGVVE